MRYALILLVLFATNLCATVTVTVEGTTPIPASSPPAVSIPDATNGVAYPSGVLVKATNISPPLGTATDGSTSRVIATWQGTGAIFPNGFTATRVEKSSTEVWFYLDGVPNDTPGTWITTLGVIQTTYSGGFGTNQGYTIGRVEFDLLPASSGGGSGGSGGSDDSGGCVGVGGGAGALAILALLGLVVVRRRDG